MKKLFIVLMSFILFFTSLIVPIQEANATVVSKVVSQAAKKIAKETIKDTAVQMSMNMVLNYKYTPKDSTMTPKDGYSFICLPKDKTDKGDCANLLQTKNNITVDDKKTIAKKVEQKLEQKISGGVTATKWGKFLDWLVPIFAVGMAYTTIDYAINGEVSELFDEIAYESLVELGHVTSTEVDITKIMELNYASSYIHSDKIFALQIWAKEFNNPYKVKNIYGDEVILSNERQYGLSFLGSIRTEGADRYFTGNFTVNGVPVDKGTFGVKLDEGELSIYGDYEQLPLELENHLISRTNIHSHLIGNPVEVPPIPRYDQLKISMTNQPNSIIPMVAPGSLPFEKTSTGEEALPYTKQDGSTGFKTRTGIEIIEDDITVNDALVEYNPDGSTTVKKAPSVADPNPEDEEIIKPNPETPKPPTETPLPQLGENLPFELIIALLDMLRSILYYMVRLSGFILSIPLIPPIPIPYESLQWFFGVEIVGVQIMTVFRSLVLFGLSLGLFKILKKVF